MNHTICCTLSLVALRKPRTFNTVSHQNASDPVAPLQAQGAPFSGQWVGKGFSAWPFSFDRARQPFGKTDRDQPHCRWHRSWNHLPLPVFGRCETLEPCDRGKGRCVEKELPVGLDISCQPQY